MAGTDDTHLDAILFNSAVRIYLAGNASSIEVGLGLARDVLGSGKAMAKLVGVARLVRRNKNKRGNSAD